MIRHPINSDLRQRLHKAVGGTNGVKLQGASLDPIIQYLSLPTGTNNNLA